MNRLLVQAEVRTPGGRLLKGSIAGSICLLCRNQQVPKPFKGKDNFMSSLARALLPWLPMGFCALTWLVTFCIDGWNPNSPCCQSFTPFLFMCFFFVGAALSETRREISELRKQVAELQHHPLT